jgi:hypothetical protein
MTAIRAVCFDAFGTLESGDWLVPNHRDAATGIRMNSRIRLNPAIRQLGCRLRS